MLSAQDRADLQEAARLGIASEWLVAEILERERVALEERAAIRPSSANERKRGLSIEDLRFRVAVAKRELELARERFHEPSIHESEETLSHFELRLAESLAQRAASRRHPPPAEPREVELPPEAVEPLSLLRRLRRLAVAFAQVATPSSVAPETPIGELDAQLCLAWDNQAKLLSGVQPSAVATLRAMKGYDAGRLLSARHAEKAAMRYYKMLGFEVKDVSATQLEPAAANWKDFDIRAGNVCIDVKNARESLHGNGHYVEHCVPTFKLSRESGAHVRIAAVVSPYLTETGPYFGWPRASTMLGEVAEADVNALIEWARGRFGDSLDLRNPRRAGFLPGWLFEFHPAHYPGRQAAVEAAPAMLGKLLDALAYSCEIPGWLWVFSDEPIPSGLPAAPVLSDLRGLRRSIGISRRSLYVLALGLALEELGREADGESQLGALMNVCQVSSKTGQEDRVFDPLGLDDPLGYVQSLVSMLMEIVSTLRRREIGVVGFRLVNPSILEGVLRGGKRMTLFAYCGGWQRHPFLARCGKSPLSLARHESCPGCSHLICDNCGHCSKMCEQCEPRQAAIASDATRVASGRRAPYASYEDDWDLSF